MFETQRPLSLSQKAARIDWTVILLVALLGTVGTVSLYSVAGGSLEPWALRHALRCAAGLGLIVVIALVPLRVWTTLAVPVYVGALCLLAAVPVVGVESLGARRWLNIAGLSIQPSEIMKVGLVLVLARYYASLPARTAARPLFIVIPLVLILVPVAFTLRQPDLGSAVLFAGLGLSVMFLAGVPVWYFAGAAAAAMVALPSLIGRLHDYQRRRLEIFLDPASDPQGAGYHITQAKVALAAGGLDGQGFLKGTQNQLDFIPEKMTDFIFVAIGEEWGFTGAVALLGVFAALIGLLSLMALRNGSAFGRFVIAGAALSLAIYVIINAAMVTGLMPVVGVPMPLISYGGTALTTLMVSLGLAMSAHVHRPRRDELRR
jgi:rod shape determining protein RodA